MSLKLGYLVSLIIFCLFLSAYAAWAAAAWLREGSLVFLAESVAALAACFALIVHGVVFWRRLDEVGFW
ncbi:MAG: hypothetical protein HYV26_11135 [Candidatus Hydrogenedentes bacterium]|nr:hypothetical protein [Candidatus Hydrogenedentota bacterium]